MAPLGGKDPKLGTNPFSVAIPANNHDDIVLDLATSQVARGKIEVAVSEEVIYQSDVALDVTATQQQIRLKASRGLLLFRRGT